MLVQQYNKPLDQLRKIDWSGQELKRPSDLLEAYYNFYPFRKSVNEMTGKYLGVIRF